MSATPARTYARFTIAIIIAAAVIGAAIFASSTYATTVTKTISVTNYVTLATTVTSTTHFAACVQLGQPGSIFIRVVSDANQSPIQDAHVTASYVASQYVSEGSSDGACNWVLMSNSSITTSFTTNNTQWYALPAQNVNMLYEYGILVDYAGQGYSFGTHPSTETVKCVTLSIPSGIWNITSAGFQTTCPPQTYSTTSTAATTTTFTTGSVLYNVTFQQIGACSPAVYVLPWSVTLGNEVRAEPPGTPLPISNGGYSAGPEPPGLYTIVFTVPDGVYAYTVAPQGAFYTYTGTVTVNGSAVSIVLDGPAVSCTTTTATSSSGT